MAAPTVPGNSVDIDRIVAGFVHTLRSGGLTVAINMSLRYRQALELVGLKSGVDVYWAGRATLVSRPEDIAMYNAMFLAFFHHDGSAFKVRFEDEVESASLAVDDGDGAGDAESHDDNVVELRYSAAEVLGQKDFAEFTRAELDEAHRVMTRMRMEPSRRSSRRRISATRGDRHDLRRTLRAAMRTAGEPLHLATTSQSERTRPLVLLLDVSGSMEAYARLLIRFAHAAVVGRGRVEVFALGTRLTRLTRQLGSHDVDEAVSAAAESVVDWSGGTRLGEAIGRFNDEWGIRGMARGAIVVILSDGWDRGAPEQMALEMERLHRTAYRVVWVNPLKASPGYEPIARGMAAAMPFIDTFLEGHSLDSLQVLSDAIGA